MLWQLGSVPAFNTTMRYLRQAPYEGKSAVAHVLDAHSLRSDMPHGFNHPGRLQDGSRMIVWETQKMRRENGSDAGLYNPSSHQTTFQGHAPSDLWTTHKAHLLNNIVRLRFYALKTSKLGLWDVATDLNPEAVSYSSHSIMLLALQALCPSPIILFPAVPGLAQL